MDSNKFSGQSNHPAQISKIQDIIDSISELQDSLSKAKSSAPQSTKDGHQNDDTQTDNNSSSSSSSQTDAQTHHSNAIGPLDQFGHDLIHMKNGLTKLKKFEDDFSQSIEELKGNLLHILTQGYISPDLTEQIDKLRKRCLNLKCKIPSAHNVHPTDSDTLHYPQTNGSKELPNLCKGGHFKENYFFQEFQKKFEGLDIPKRLCLLCLAVFPENALIKKRLLVHWWIGERFLDTCLKPNQKDKEEERERVKTADEIAGELLQEFEAKGFIRSVDKKHRKVAASFKMYPHIRSVVIMLAKAAKFFDYDSDGIPTLNFQNCNRACLVYAKEGSIQERLEKVNGPNLNHEIKTLFNVSEIFPDFKPDWFGKMNSVRVLYLGRWQSSDEHAHIEVESTEYLKGLKNMRDLRLLSLQGIYGIQEISSSISFLTSLKVLDLRACYNLEKLPHEIGFLKKLTHLDISECYLLDAMPKELCSLSQLQVFKGFVISDTKQGTRCNLDNLENLTQLRKLSISINSVNSQIDKLSTVVNFKQLLKLRVSWGVVSSKANRAKADTVNRSTTVTRFHTLRNQSTLKRSDRAMNVGSKSKLQKLDLQCYPEEKLPIWLNPEDMKNLENLYIRGGQLNRLGGECQWPQVKVLRLKFLNELKTNWKALQALFPNLEYLEKFKCLKVTLCPCDGRGVWEKSKPEKQSNANEERAS